MATVKPLLCFSFQLLQNTISNLYLQHSNYLSLFFSLFDLVKVLFYAISNACFTSMYFLYHICMICKKIRLWSLGLSMMKHPKSNEEWVWRDIDSRLSQRSCVQVSEACIVEDRRDVKGKALWTGQIGKALPTSDYSFQREFVNLNKRLLNYKRKQCPNWIVSNPPYRPHGPRVVFTCKATYYCLQKWKWKQDLSINTAPYGDYAHVDPSFLKPWSLKWYRKFGISNWQGCCCCEICSQEVWCNPKHLVNSSFLSFRTWKIYMGTKILPAKKLIID